jgi:uncharacterized membrane protein
MTNSETKPDSSKPAAKYAILAAVVALVGIADSGYLTAKHLSGARVPCTVTGGCETVLTSSYSEIFGIPTAAFGVLAYLLAFSLALLTAFGNRAMWKVFGVIVLIMTGFSLWLIYLQAFVIGAFCQYCLLSAATTFTLFVIYVSSILFRSK